MNLPAIIFGIGIVSIIVSFFASIWYEHRHRKDMMTIKLFLYSELK